MTSKLLAAFALALLVSTASASARAEAEAARLPPTDHVAQIGSQQFHFLRAGSGETTIVLLHGWPQSSHEWRRVMPLLADRFTVVAPDLPGVGGSSGPAGGASAPAAAFEKEALARELHPFIASLGARKIVLVGHDIGGMVAYAYARLYPSELAGVAILDVPLPGVAPWDAVKTTPQAWHFNFHRMEPLAEQLVTGRQALYFRAFIDSHAVDRTAVSAADVAAYAAAYRSPASLHAGFGFYRAFAADEAFDASHHNRFDVPILLVGADQSMGSGEAQLEQGLRALGATDVHVAVVPACGHWLAEEKPRETAGLVAHFASSLQH